MSIDRRITHTWVERAVGRLANAAREHGVEHNLGARRGDQRDRQAAVDRRRTASLHESVAVGEADEVAGVVGPGSRRVREPLPGPLGLGG